MRGIRAGKLRGAVNLAGALYPSRIGAAAVSREILAMRGSHVAGAPAPGRQIAAGEGAAHESRPTFMHE